MFHNRYVTLDNENISSFWVKVTVTRPVWSKGGGLREVFKTNNVTE